MLSYLLLFVISAWANPSVKVDASSIENNLFLPQFAFDGNIQTRWSSQFSDPQWLKIDLGEPKDIVGLVLNWEAAYAKSYDILLSQDEKRWAKVYSTTEGDGLIDDIYFGKRKTRYIKIFCTEKATQWGYSLWELRLKGLDEELILNASSSDGTNIAENAMDGDNETIWHSGKTDIAWLEIDTKKENNLGGIFIDWGEDYATSYRIEVAADRKIWKSVYEHTDAIGGLDKINVNILRKRYIRIIGEGKNMDNGYSIKEVNFKNWEDISKHSSLEVVRGIVGWEDYQWVAFVGRDGSFALEPQPYQVSFWIFDNKKDVLYTPETLSTTWRLKEKGLPISIVNWRNDDIDVTTTVFARRLNSLNRLITFARTTLKNKASTNKDLSLYLVIRSNPLATKWNSKLTDIEYDGDRLIKVNGKTAIFSKVRPLFETGNFYDALEFAKIGSLEPKKKLMVNQEKRGGALVYQFSLNPGEEKAYDFIVLSAEASEPSLLSLQTLDFLNNLKGTEEYWRGRTTFELKLPDEEYVNCFYASIYYILMMMKEGKLYPGPYNYKSFFLHDAVDMANALDKVGLSEVVDKALEHFNYKEGGGYLDELGGSIFALYEHYRMTKDKEFLSKVYSRIKESCLLIKKLRKEQMSKDTKDSPTYGLLPKSVSQDNFKFPAHLYVDNWWAIIGLKAGLEAAEILNKEEDILWLKQEYEGLLNCTLASIKKVMGKEGLNFMLAFADYWPKEMRIVDSDHRILGDTQMAWAHRPALFPGQSLGIPLPLELFANSYRQYWQEAGRFSAYDGGWYVKYEKLFWGYNVKLAHPLIYLGMEDVALKNIRWSIEHQSCPRGWAEAMNTKVNEQGLREIDEGIVGDIPHGWVAAHYILLLRDMLLREEGGKLILLSCIPESWLDDGKIIEVKNAPTYFGKVSFKVISFRDKGYLKLTIDAKTPPPDGYFIYSPFKKVFIPKDVKETIINLSDENNER